MKKLIITLIAITIGLLLSVSAFAFDNRDGYGPGEKRGTGYCANAGFNRLDLSDEQKEKIETLISTSQKEIRPIREKLFDKSAALRRLWLQENPDKDKIIALRKEVRTLHDDMEDKATALRFEIRKVLTTEQQEKLTSFRWGRGHGFGPRGRMKGRGGYGPGICY